MANKGLGKRLPTLALMLVAIIWGAGFMAVKIALDSGYSSGLILVCRFGVACAAMAAFGWRKILPVSRREVGYGALAGLLLFLGFYVQTLGMGLTTPSNNGFFTATNVIMVPLIAWALQKRRPPAKLLLCCALALAGFFVLSYSDAGFGVNAGDLLTLLCAFFFACHIAYLGLVSPRVEAWKLTFLQLAFAGLFSVAGFCLVELPTLGEVDFVAGLPAVLFSGLLSTFLCYYLQTWAQGRTSSGKAAVLMSCESLWCAVFSVMLGYEQPSGQMAAGGLLIVGAVCLLELDGLPWGKGKKAADEAVVA